MVCSQAAHRTALGEHCKSFAVSRGPNTRNNTAYTVVEVLGAVLNVQFAFAKRRVASATLEALLVEVRLALLQLDASASEVLAARAAGRQARRVASVAGGVVGSVAIGSNERSLAPAREQLAADRLPTPTARTSRALWQPPHTKQCAWYDRPSAWSERPLNGLLQPAHGAAVG